MSPVISHSRIPLLATAVVCALLYVTAGLLFPGFFSVAVLVNLLSDNAFLGLAAIGMTFVILAGGIDLSVGAMVGFGSILIARLTAHAGWHPLAAAALLLAIGIAFGAGQGALIHFCRLPAFLVTLGGMFLVRGAGFIVSLESLSIQHPLYKAIDEFGYHVFPVTSLVFLTALLISIYIAHWTTLGRAIYAVGGDETSASLMGLPVGRTKVAVYALSGLCSAAAGVVCTLYTASGSAAAGAMLELDAIAAVVIGGTLLSGGVGSVFGTLLGVLIYGILQTAIAFQGTLSSWWTRIAIGALLLVFILLQKFVQVRITGKDSVQT